MMQTIILDQPGQFRLTNTAAPEAHGGRLIFVGLMQGDITFNDPFFHRREITLLASRNATADDMRGIIAQIDAGAIDTIPWITHRAGCDTLIERFPGWLQPGSGLIKGMLSFDDEGAHL